MHIKKTCIGSCARRTDFSKHEYNLSRISNSSFDKRGNYSIGLNEQLMFPEIQFDQIDAIRGMDITIVTTAKTDKEALTLLTELGMPFEKK